MRMLACVVMVVCLSFSQGRINIVCAADISSASAYINDSYDPFEKTGADADQQQVADPLEKFNRGMFIFNDKLYYYALKPAAQGYGFIVPEPVRMCVKRFFLNLATPVRLVNCCLQGKFGGAGVELTRFAVNTTAGVCGLFDPAYYCWRITRHDEDTGRTFGRYGIGHGIYLVWPILGPSSIRDTFGFAGDMLLDPLFYADMAFWQSATIDAYEMVNNVSLKINDYDEFKKSALDPYVSMKNAYIQNRGHALQQ